MRLLKLGAATALLALAFLVNPHPARAEAPKPADQEEEAPLPDADLVQAFGGLYRDERLQGYVEAVGVAVAEAAQSRRRFTFAVLNSPRVNAFATREGHVYVTRGLLGILNSEAELAAVLAHEVAHVVARHALLKATRSIVSEVGLTMLSQLVDHRTTRVAQREAKLLLRGYSREDELEADALSIGYVVRAGYDANAVPAALARLRDLDVAAAKAAGRSPEAVDRPNPMSTHPTEKARIDAVRHLVQNKPAKASRSEPDRHMGALDGVLFGDDPVHGLVRGRSFVHPHERFRFTVPPGFRLTNLINGVRADGPGGLILFDDEELGAGRSLVRYVEREWLPRARVEAIQTFKVDGMEAVSGVVMTSRARFRLAAVRFADDRIYRFIIATPARMPPQAQRAVEETFLSFRYLRPREASALQQPWRLRVVAAEPGATLEQLAAQSAVGPATLRLINGVHEGAPLPSLLKTVTD